MRVFVNLDFLGAKGLPPLNILEMDFGYCGTDLFLPNNLSTREGFSFEAFFWARDPSLEGLSAIASFSSAFLSLFFMNN